MDNQDDIEKFFNKETPPIERESLSRKIIEDNDEDQILAIQIGEALKDKKSTDDLRNRLSLIAVETKTNKIYYYRIWVAAAVISLLAVSSFVIFEFSRSSSEEILFDEYFRPYSGVVNTRGDASIPIQGYQDYTAHDYQRALQQFIDSDEPKGDTLKLLIANCYLGLDDTKNGILWLNRIGADASFSIQQSRDWYLALAFLLSGNIDESKLLLNHLIEAKSIYSKRALLLLKEPRYQ